MTKMSVSIKTFVVFILISFYMIFYGIWISAIDSSSIAIYSTLLFSWVIIALLFHIICFYG